MLKDAIEHGHALATIVREVAVLGQTQGKYGGTQNAEGDSLVTPEHLTDLEQLAASKIRERAQEGNLLATPRLIRTLYLWKDWEGEQAVQQWVLRTIETDEGLAGLLESALARTRSQFAGDWIVRESPRLDPESLRPFVDPDSLIDRVSILLESGKLTDGQQVAASQFVREYRLRREGKNPDDFVP